MSRPHILAAILLAALVAPHSASAQTGGAPRAPSACTYETCALRIEPAFFWSPKLVRGRTGEEVGRLGGFGGGVDTLLAGPDSAAAYARVYVTNVRRSAALGLIGGIAYVVASVTSNGFRDTDDTSVAIALTGAGFAIASIPFTIRAQRSLSRAVWFYNASLAAR
jgi:hypothetical protein